MPELAEAAHFTHGKAREQSVRNDKPTPEDSEAAFKIYDAMETGAIYWGCAQIPGNQFVNRRSRRYASAQNSENIS
jgi:hypothetical protein